MKKVLSLIVAVMMIITSVAVVCGEEVSFDGYVYMTVERLTLGQGLVQEPVKVGYYKDDTLADITERMLGERSTYKGDMASYYLEGIVDGGEPANWKETDIPKDIYSYLSDLGDGVEERAVSTTLQTGDYSMLSGWMFTIDNTGANAGPAGIKLGEDTSTGLNFAEGSVIRLGFSLYGYGKDIGIGLDDDPTNPWYIPFDTTNTFADRSSLISYIAEINSDGDKELYGEAYVNAVNLLNKWDITEEEIDSAITLLDEINTSTPDEPQVQDNHRVQWRGAMNHSNGNAVTDVKITKDTTEEKWAYPLNRTVGSWGAYYAGQTVIVDDYLYATGGGKLHKINIETGKGDETTPAGSSSFTYDYLAYGDGMIFVSTGSKIEAFDIDTLNSLGSVSGSFGQYHPIQYNNGYIVCNGNIFKTDKTSENVFTQVGTTTVGGETFNWSQGVFADDYFYAVSTNNIYCVNYTTNEVVEKYQFSETRTTSANIGGQLAYDETTGYMYWGSYKENNLYTIHINENGGFDTETLVSSDIGQMSVCPPVIYNGRAYIAGQRGAITVVNADIISDEFMKVIYTATSDVKLGKIQSNPILTTAYEEGTGNVYIYFQGYSIPGNIFYLEDNSQKTEGEIKQLTNLSTTNKSAYAFEQIAVDNDGRIYFYNEEGYLYCYGDKEVHDYEYECNFDGTHKKVCLNCGREETENCEFVTDEVDTHCIHCDCKKEQGIYGDIDQSGEINVQDAVILQKYTVKAVTLDEKQTFYSMFDGTEIITIKNVTILQRYIANSLTETEIGTKAVRYY